MKKEIPLLFSLEMVSAILDGRKAMTRRKAPFDTDCTRVEIFFGKWQMVWNKSGDPEKAWFEMCNTKCPYGKPGDILWVREEHYRFGHWEKNGFTKKGKQKWRFVAVPGSDIFFSDSTLPEKPNKSRVKGKEEFNLLYKRLARFMPKSAARIWLEVTEVRVERLWDITEEDAKKEGIKRIYNTTSEVYKNYQFKDDILIAKDSFKSLWQSINGPESWNANPFVWVVSFKVLSTTGRPEAAQPKEVPHAI